MTEPEANDVYAAFIGVDPRLAGIRAEDLMLVPVRGGTIFVTGYPARGAEGDKRVGVSVSLCKGGGLRGPWTLHLVVDHERKWAVSTMAPFMRPHEAAWRHELPLA